MLAQLRDVRRAHVHGSFAVTEDCNSYVEIELAAAHLLML